MFTNIDLKTFFFYKLFRYMYSSVRQCYICISYLRLRCSNYFHFPRIAPGSDSALKVQNVIVCAEITWFDNTSPFRLSLSSAMNS